MYILYTSDVTKRNAGEDIGTRFSPGLYAHQPPEGAKYETYEVDYLVAIIITLYPNAQSRFGGPDYCDTVGKCPRNYYVLGESMLLAYVSSRAKGDIDWRAERVALGSAGTFETRQEREAAEVLQNSTSSVINNTPIVHPHAELTGKNYRSTKAGLGCGFGQL